jgi:hypothetical protein
LYFFALLTFNNPKSLILNHILTLSRVDIIEIRKQEERRREINSRPSRLKDLAILFYEQFKKSPVSLMNHQDDGQFQESYCVRQGEYEARLAILSYHDYGSVPSLVKEPQTVRHINFMRTELTNFSPSASFHQHSRLFEFPTKVFVTVGDCAIFETDNDLGIWSIWLCDKKNCVSASLTITHHSLLEDDKSSAQRHTR